MSLVDASEWARVAALEAAAAVVAGSVGVIEGCRRLADLAHHLVPDWTADPDFVIFGALASDTDRLPTGSARKYWSAEALEREDRDIQRIEADSRDEVVAACQNVLQRFGGSTEESSAGA
jgi:hypothetical protein